MSKFTIGDTVSLKSGGPLMTVREYKQVHTSADNIEEMVHCSWFDSKDELQFNSFYESELKTDSPGPKISFTN